MNYRVAITRAFAEPDGTTVFGDIGLSRLDAAGVEWCVLDEARTRIDACELDGFDAVLVLGPERVDAASIPAGGRLRHVARFGAGFDAVDVAACSAAGVIVTNTPAAVRRPVADAALAMLYALAHNLLPKDRLVREGRWDERGGWRGRGIHGRTIGIVGLGGIGIETARLLIGLGVKVIAYNRSDRTEWVRKLGIEQLPLDDVLARSDYLIVTVSGNPGTAGLIGARELALMPPTSQLINVARGSVIDEGALIAALAEGRIAGAGLDVFDAEPLSPASPLARMENVVLAPHSLCWTDDFTATVGASAIDALIDVACGELPRHPVNPDVWGQPRNAVQAR